MYATPACSSAVVILRKTSEEVIATVLAWALAGVPI